MPYAFSKPESVNDSLWPWDASGMRPNFRQICNNAAKAQYPIYEMKEVVYQGKNSYTLGMRPYGTPSYAKSGYILQFRHKGHHINMSLNMSHVAWRARLEPRKIPRYDPVTWGPVTRVSEYIIVYMAVAFDETIPYENWQLSTPKLGHNFQHQVYLIRSFAQAMAQSCPTTQVDLIIGTLDRSSWKKCFPSFIRALAMTTFANASTVW
jgi:hypothetical protein